MSLTPIYRFPYFFSLLSRLLSPLSFHARACKMPSRENDVPKPKETQLDSKPTSTFVPSSTSLVRLQTTIHLNPRLGLLGPYFLQLIINSWPTTSTRSSLLPLLPSFGSSPLSCPPSFSFLSLSDLSTPPGLRFNQPTRLSSSSRRPYVLSSLYLPSRAWKSGGERDGGEGGGAWKLKWKKRKLTVTPPLFASFGQNEQL